MKVSIKKMVAAVLMAGGFVAVNAGVCNIVPGSVTCSKGTVDNLLGNGMVTVNGTTVSGATIVNGVLNAENANFNLLEVNGSASLIQSTINNAASIKGSLNASSTKFESTLEIFSSETRFINSKVVSDLRIGHTDSKKQVVYLDNFSEVSGNIIFEDEDGEVIMRGQSKIGGKVIGGHTTLQ
ncbi:MAG: hypothetical protein H0U75_09845 [Legionella sp.]|nr:hypothetical protein [Legionella sp.]